MGLSRTRAPAAAAVLVQPLMKSVVPVRLSGDQSAHAPLSDKAECCCPGSGNGLAQTAPWERGSDAQILQPRACARGLSWPAVQQTGRQSGRTPHADYHSVSQLRYGDIGHGALDDWVQVISALVPAHAHARELVCVQCCQFLLRAKRQEPVPDAPGLACCSQGPDSLRDPDEAV